MRLRVLGRRDDVGLSWWALCNHKGPYEREARGEKSEKDTEAKVGGLFFENG